MRATGAGGGASVKIACASATADPLLYTEGYTPDPTIRDNARRQRAPACRSAEKQQQMSGLPQSGTGNFNVFEQEDNPRRDIKGFKFRDGPRGVNLNANGDGKHDYSTSFPVAMARGAAFDDDLEFHIGQAIGDEMLVVGQHDDAGARRSTSSATRPGAARRRPTARIRSCSGASAARSRSACSSYVAACAKHYAANNIENGRQSANAMMDEQTLREIYARHFEMVIRGGRRLRDHGGLQPGQRHARRRRARTC